MFMSADTDGDRRMDLKEFKAGCRKMKINLTDTECTICFDKIDRNGGGQVR